MRSSSPTGLLPRISEDNAEGLANIEPEQITMDSRMKIAVLSDLMVEDLVNGRRPSLLRVSDAESNAEMHPITGLRMLIQTHRIKADLLLCGGDWEQGGTGRHKVRLGESPSRQKMAKMQAGCRDRRQP